MAARSGKTRHCGSRWPTTPGPASRGPARFAGGSRKPQTGRTAGPRPRLDLIGTGPPATAHARWRPGRAR